MFETRTRGARGDARGLPGETKVRLGRCVGPKYGATRGARSGQVGAERRASLRREHLAKSFFFSCRFPGLGEWFSIVVGRV